MLPRPHPLRQYVPLGAVDAGPYITAIRPDADVVFAFQTGADAMRFVPAYEQYGLKKRLPLVGFNSPTDESIIPKQGDSALGIIGAGTWSAARQAPATQTFTAASKKRYNCEATLGAAQGCDGAMMLDKALRAIATRRYQSRD